MKSTLKKLFVYVLASIGAMAVVLLLTQSARAGFDLQITEIWMGQ